jgi:hypothetical protein
MKLMDIGVGVPIDQDKIDRFNSEFNFAEYRCCNNCKKMLQNDADRGICKERLDRGMSRVEAIVDCNTRKHCYCDLHDHWKQGERL